MKIHIAILDDKTRKNGFIKPIKMFFEGNYALESCILKLIEIYFGTRIRDKVEDLLKTRITDEEIIEEMEKM